MKITYTDDVDSVSQEQLQGFFAGWPEHPSPKQHLTLLKRSDTVWLAFDQDCCVGFINALSDQVLFAYIPLLEVRPGYQGRGIGKELVKRMLTSLKDLYAVDVVCDESVAPFYDGLGLSRCVGMVKRNYENQGTANKTLHRTPTSGSGEF